MHQTTDRLPYFSPTVPHRVIARKLSERVKMGVLDDGGINLGAETNKQLATLVAGEFAKRAIRVVLRKTGSNMGLGPSGIIKRDGSQSYMVPLRDFMVEITAYGPNYKS